MQNTIKLYSLTDGKQIEICIIKCHISYVLSFDYQFYFFSEKKTLTLKILPLTKKIKMDLHSDICLLPSKKGGKKEKKRKKK